MELRDDEFEGDINHIGKMMRLVREKAEAELKKRLYDLSQPFHHPFGFSFMGHDYEVHGQLTNIEGKNVVHGVRYIVSRVNSDGTLTDFIHITY